MQKVDIDLLRKDLGKFTLNEKEYVVREATLEQLIHYDSRSQSVLDEIEQIEDESQKYICLWNWRVEQVTIWVPDLSKEQVEDLTPGQIDAILAVVNGDIDTKKKKQRKGKGRG